MKNNILLLFLCLFIGKISLPASQEKPAPHIWDGSHTTPVHRILLKDQFDQNIIPSESYPLPYSVRFTCAPCHDYKVIEQGLHFNNVRSDAAGRPGEPWIWLDAQTGTVLPLSYQRWPGTWHPSDLGLSAWDFTLLFGRHLTGGGVSEPAEENMTPQSRWDVSGRLEINCLGCHNVDREQSHSEWAKQVIRQNFRWAGVAASGLGEVGGMALRLPGTWDIIDGPNPDDSEYAVVPSVAYNKTDFDSRHRVFFDITRRPDNERCLTCHSTSPVGEKKMRIDGDVHFTAGMRCADCHRNDLSHAMIRGYEGEAEATGDPTRADFTCRGCHLGGEKEHSRAGRLGAPYPLHKGLPVVHFEKLSCTVCHSGSAPDSDLTRVRTSRANRLGIYGIAQWFTELPNIVEPVFKKDNSGVILPHRLVWPAFWGKKLGENIIPLPPAVISAAAGNILTVEEDAAHILAALSATVDLNGIPILVVAGHFYSANIDGRLDVTPGPVLEAVSAVQWKVKRAEKYEPLIPEFDPAAEDVDLDAENQIHNTLEALAVLSGLSGTPALVYKKYLYQVIDGYLEKKEWSGTAEEGLILGVLSDEQLQPLLSDFILSSIAATVGNEHTLTYEQITSVLHSLEASGAQTEKAEYYCYFSGGKMYRLDKEGRLATTTHPVAEPVLWPLAHNVRPARQSLGINGCKDCHSAGSDFFFSRIQGTGPVKTDSLVTRSNHTFMGLDKLYQKMYGLSFTARPGFKVVLFIAGLFIGSILLLVFLLSLGRWTGLIQKGGRK